MTKNRDNHGLGLFLVAILLVIFLAVRIASPPTNHPTDVSQEAVTAKPEPVSTAAEKPPEQIKPNDTLPSAATNAVTAGPEVQVKFCRIIDHALAAWSALSDLLIEEQNGVKRMQMEAALKKIENDRNLALRQLF